MSQWDMMEKDTVLVLNDNDEILGAASKKTSHVFEPGQPRGIVHRAFSVFLFDASTNELLLQQRASSKITFPNVRTNTQYVSFVHSFVRSSTLFKLTLSLKFYYYYYDYD